MASIFINITVAAQITRPFVKGDVAGDLISTPTDRIHPQANMTHWVYNITSHRLKADGSLHFIPVKEKK
ncbi:MAG: hypothetical protein ACE5D7_01510 [Fidelibacterota bacterium]